MAEIKIKKKSPVWPWIILLIIIILGILYYLYYMGNDVTDPDNPNIEQIDDESYNSPSENDINESRDWDDEPEEDSLSKNSE